MRESALGQKSTGEYLILEKSAYQETPASLEVYEKLPRQPT